MPESWGKVYPRLHDLFENSDKSHPDNYFALFTKWLEHKIARNVYAELEKRLSLLSSGAWTALRGKALPYVVKKDGNRAWTQLFDTLNEVYGYELLLRAGYNKENIAFIQSSKSAPDLEGMKKDEATLVEVKTINYSNLEIERLNEWPPKAWRAHRVMPETLVKKIDSTVKKAILQLESYCSNTGKRKLILILLSLDSNTRLGSQLYRQVDDIKSRYSNCEVEIQIINGLN